MMEQSTALFGSFGPEHYQIRVKGRLERRWEHWFDGLQLNIDHDTTMLSGTLADQAALYGVLLKIRDLGLPLISVQHLPLALHDDTQGGKV
jgi:hypothetical protein